MKKFKLCFIVLLGGLLIMFNSCSTESLDEVSQDTDIFARSSNSNQDVIARASGDVIGSATLHRKKDRVTANIHTSGLTPGDAYTVWFVIFDTPTPPPLAVIYATGGVVGDNGVANFKSALSEGDDNGSLFGVLTDAEHQGVHMVIRSHGPADLDPVILHEQITTLNGGCPGGVGCTDDADVIFYPL